MLNSGGLPPEARNANAKSKSVNFEDGHHPERLCRKRCGRLKRLKYASEESYPGDLVSEDEDPQWLDGDSHAMKMYDTDEDTAPSPKMFDPAWYAKTFGPSYTGTSDYDNWVGPQSPGWRYMTPWQRAAYWGKFPQPCAGLKVPVGSDESSSSSGEDTDSEDGQDTEVSYDSSDDDTIMMMQAGQNLHDCESTIGIDTDAARSVTCFESDLLWVDKSEKAIRTASINGVGGGVQVLGRGPMACGLQKTASGKMAVLIDPNGVLVRTRKGQRNFRVFGQQHMKTLGVRLVQLYDGKVTAMHGEDVLECIYTKEVVPLVTQRGILVMNSTPIQVEIPKEVVSEIANRERSALVFVDTPTIMMMNESRLTDEQLARLYHHRLAHPADDVPVKMGVTKTRLNEDCLCCDKAKFKTATFKRNDPMIHQKNPPFWRVYADGYGGGLKGSTEGSSMGGTSYEGAVGGYVFSDPTTGTLRRKLYATTEQFPAILHQFLTDVESEHFTCRELYVDTHVVNLSKEVEDVAAQFQTKIVPISAGTPQELAYAESGVRTIAKISRSTMLGAPHLPKWCWGLSDLNATNIHDVLPQKSKGNKSPYEMRTGKIPNYKELHVKVFGAPCSYAPMGGAEHKRGQLTERGFYLGMQWPMCLVLDKATKKVVSVSRKKIRVYEGAYIDKAGGAELPPVDSIELDDLGNLLE